MFIYFNKVLLCLFKELCSLTQYKSYIESTRYNPIDILFFPQIKQ